MGPNERLTEAAATGGLLILEKALAPFVEAGEMISDRLRLYRWKSSLAIIEKAKIIAAQHGVKTSEIPVKFLIPFLEKSSLEDEKSPLSDR